jgi:hypothetical protein
MTFLIITNSDNSLSVEEESREILNALSQEDALGNIRVKHIPSANLSSIISTFQTYKRIDFIHYAGHADGQTLHLDSSNAYGIGLAHFFKEASVIFLNGCATQGHVEILQSKGIPAVIATNATINDQKAKTFAIAFYQWIGNGSTLSKAFEMAIGQLLTEYGDKHFEVSKRGLKLRRTTKSESTEWELHILDEAILNWNISTSPPIITDVQNLLNQAEESIASTNINKGIELIQEVLIGKHFSTHTLQRLKRSFNILKFRHQQIIQQEFKNTLNPRDKNILVENLLQFVEYCEKQLR